MLKLQAPLSEAELDELSAFLGAEDAPENRLPIVACDGFFAALFSSPETILPREWLPVVLSGDELRFESLEDSQRVLGLLMRFYNEVGAALHDDSSDYCPAIADESGELSPGAAILWALGYIQGVALRADAWQPLFNSDTGDAILPIFELSRFGEPKSRRKLGSARTLRFARALGESAMRIYDFWLERRLQALKPVRRKSPKIGRNEACACGSGRKYKLCCGKA